MTEFLRGAGSPGAILRRPICGLAIALAGLGIVLTASLTWPPAAAAALAGRQALALAAGVAALVLCAAVPPATWQRAQPWLTGGSLILLYGVLLLGPPIHGTRAWFLLPLPWGGTLSCQPSELAKPLFVLFLARHAAQPERLPGFGWREFGGYAGLAGCWLLPLALQPDFGAVLVFALALAGLYALQGGRWRQLLAAAWLAALGALLAWHSHPYLRRRLGSFLEPGLDPEGASWHLRQLRRALAEGGLWGRGFGAADWSTFYVPLPATDSCFAGLGETLGFGGCGLLLAAALLVLAAAWNDTRTWPDPFAATAGAGLCLMLTLGLVVHVSANLGLMPITGVTLPLLSFGGSSLVGTLASVGVYLSLARARARAPAPPAA